MGHKHTAFFPSADTSYKEVAGCGPERISVTRLLVWLLEVCVEYSASGATLKYYIWHFMVSATQEIKLHM